MEGLEVKVGVEREWRSERWKGHDRQGQREERDPAQEADLQRPSDNVKVLSELRRGVSRPQRFPLI